MTDQEIIDVVTAHKAGKPIQRRYKYDPTFAWVDAHCSEWTFDINDYRIKPEPPKPREWWIIPNADTKIWSSECVIATWEPLSYDPERSKFIHVREVL